jgi:peptidoglycan-N-acetylmuramic acid deacetylase
MGPHAGKPRELDAAAYCAELERPARRFQAMTGQPMGRSSARRAARRRRRCWQAARGCGWTHVGWAPAGFLGDELPSDKPQRAAAGQQALRDIRAGDILVAHLGIWSRRDPWAPAVLEPLITGLKQRGFCFATLREHPQYGAAAMAVAK